MYKIENPDQNVVAQSTLLLEAYADYATSLQMVSNCGKCPACKEMADLVLQDWTPQEEEWY